MIKQSPGKRANGPVLWAGDVDDYVDFGSFNETVTNDGSKYMTFTFHFEFAVPSIFRVGEMIQQMITYILGRNRRACSSLGLREYANFGMRHRTIIWPFAMERPVVLHL